MQFFIKGIEIIKKRNKRKHRCLDEWWNSDEMILKKHIETHGCRAPYQTSVYKQFPMCNTKEKIQESIFEVFVAKKQYYPKPCQVLSKLEFGFYESDEDGTVDQFTFDVAFPDAMKIITQSRAVDGHSLLGNVGGYIGLFLGKQFLISKINLNNVSLCIK